MSELNNYFKYKCFKGLKNLGLADKKEYVDRLNYEIEVITNMDFCGYLLIVQDFLNWARSKDILTGPARGSAGGSLACYTLGIITMDPIYHNLIFERFLNPQRISMCDIDCDFAKSGRATVLQYIVDKYGAECVAGIGTLNFQKAKSVVRNVTRALGYEYSVGDRLSNLLLNPISGKPQSIETSIEKVTELKEIYESAGQEAEVLKWSLRLEDTIYSIGSHASGYCIANKPITEYLPTFNSKDGFPVSQWTMNEVEEVGIVKFDFLGIAALDKIKRCIDLIKKRHNIDINVYKLPLDDQKTFELLKTGNVLGLFQLEGSSGMKDLILRIQPDTFEDIVASNAIFRPGPMESGAHDRYVAVKHGIQEAEYLVDAMEPILKTTYGNMIYQEQLMEITRVCCGFSMAEADIARKGVAKKKEKVLKELKPKFMDGWKRNGHPENKGEQMWKDILACSSYLFNRSHSVGYSLTTYYTAYLKANYPAEFMCSIMCEDADNRDQMIQYFAECKQMGIKILPPDINKSEELFTLNEDGNILFGISPIKNVGTSADIIIKRREDKPYKNLEDFCKRLKHTKVNRLRIESLIRSGAFDSLADRATNLKTLSTIWDFDEELKKYEKKVETYNKRLKAYLERKEEIAAGSKKKSMKKPKEPEEPIIPEVGVPVPLIEEEILKNERDLLGFYTTGHPLDEYQESGMLSSGYVNISSMNELSTNANVKSMLVVSSVNEITTRKKQKMAYILFEDLTGSIETTVFPRQFDNMKHLMVAGAVVEVAATVEINEIDTQKVVKFILRGMSLAQKRRNSRVRPIEIDVPAEKLGKAVNVINRFRGDKYQVIINMKGTTNLRIIPKTKINGPKKHFIQEIENAI